MTERAQLLAQLRRRVGRTRAAAIHVAIGIGAVTAHGMTGAPGAHLAALKDVDDVAILRELLELPDDELAALGDAAVELYVAAQSAQSAGSN